ncbi:hypothetical protein [Gilvimarinus polysaccharolyticus]|uniref:hypothetical protein n=1 Tax=Gilvimarinus polysaccharolyticus TaxID=863921 RepID=UPI000673AEF5|nr:hypothetical protein [Gilvimarinus polysaccharolyticus]
MKPVIAVILFALTCQLQAETLRIPIGQQEKTGEYLTTPATGVTKTHVKDTYGEPIKQSGPVGTPPIYTWVYNDFVVYFESDRVIHSVIKFTPKVKPTTPEELSGNS